MTDKEEDAVEDRIMAGINCGFMNGLQWCLSKAIDQEDVGTQFLIEDKIREVEYFDELGE